MFAFIDEIRRRCGEALDLAGLGPQTADHRLVARFCGARVLAYSPKDARGRAVLIVPAPYKQPYIWDLAPEVSVVRRCLARGLRVYLLDWTRPSPSSPLGLADYALRLPAQAMEVIAAETGRGSAIVAGHSLGGAFAAIFASLRPERLEALWLIDAPLAFGEVGGPLAQAAAAAPESATSPALGSWPGSLVSQVCALALPDIFVMDRWTDFALSLADPAALELHLRVIRWTLDEFPLPARLAAEILQLYREDRFMKGDLMVGDEIAAVAALRMRVIAVVNPAGRVVPPQSALMALKKAGAPCRILTYEADRGCVLQHLGPLVSRAAHRTIWPRILETLEPAA